ncbi:MAG: butyrate kinase, partial [Planctomycetota bacterium]
RAAAVIESLAYGLARSICGCMAALRRAPDAVVLTGGMSRSARLVRAIRKRVRFAGPLLVYRRNLEMEALAGGAARVLRGRERARQYG